MSSWKAKRFWKEALAVKCDHGWTVELDGRAVKTPAKAALVVPTQAMAEAIAEEWRAQEATVDPRTMPVTRAANSAIDKVVPQRAEVVALIAAYGGSDLLCYRATSPKELIERQAAGWNQWLDWAAQNLGATLQTGHGVMHIAQNARALEILHEKVAAFDEFSIAALHDLVGLSGSLVLGLAVCARALPPEDAWSISRIDEDWQAELWGIDEDAERLAALKRLDFLHAFRFLTLLDAPVV
ncbi:MAG TPA: ATPase [Rhodobacteraceae bacterium]|jgi:chaperone required for assembly of F1-ATPase|nr:ATPase [Paracoccaceae bacterium]HBV54183.1 ATPase [Paracoccaceae bacterium]